MRSERIIEMANSQQHPNGDDYEKRVLYIAIPLGRWSSEKLLNKGETLCQSIASELSQNALAGEVGKNNRNGEFSTTPQRG